MIYKVTNGSNRAEKMIRKTCQQHKRKQAAHRLECRSEWLHNDMTNDTEGVSQFEVQRFCAVLIIGGAAAPVAGAHEAPDASAGVQDTSNVLLGTIYTQQR